MANKTVVTVTYDDDSTETIEISSAYALTNSITEITDVYDILKLIQTSKVLDGVIRENSLKSIAVVATAE